MQERAKRTRQQILTAASEEFSQKGLHGARVDEIAKRAQVNKERIYAYFGSKDPVEAETNRATVDAAYVWAGTVSRPIRCC